MTRRSALILGMLLLAAAGALLLPRCGGDVPEAGSSRGPQDEATPPPPSGGLAPLGGPAGEAPPPPQSPPAGPVEVPAAEALQANTRTRGFVVDEVDGRPIVGATVRGEADVGDEIGLGPPATTDARGYFDAVVVNDDGAHLLISAPGYRGRSVYKHPTGSESAILLRRENRTRVRLRLSGDVADGDRFRVFRGDDSMTVGGGSSPWGPFHPVPPPPLETWDPEVAELPVVSGILELPDLFDPGVARLFVAGPRGSAGPFWVHAPARGGGLDVPLRILPPARVDVLVTRAGVPVEGVSLLVSGEGIRRDLASATTDAAGHALLTAFDVPGRTVLVVSPVAASVPLADGALRRAIELQPFEAARDAGLAEQEAARARIAPPAPAPIVADPNDAGPLGLVRPVPVEPAQAPPLPPEPAPGSLVGVIQFETWPPLEFGFPTAIPLERGTDGHAPSPVRCSFGGPDFQFPSLAPGRYLLVLRCGALVAATDGPVEVRSGETTDVGKLPLRRGAVLAGRVLDAADSPRPFTRVTVTYDGGDEPFVAWTDPDGVYRVEGLWLGTFTATVGVEGQRGFARAEALVAGSAEHRLDLHAAAPR